MANEQTKEPTVRELLALQAELVERIDSMTALEEQMAGVVADLEQRLSTLERYVAQDSLSKNDELHALGQVRCASSHDLQKLEAFERRVGQVEQRMVLHDDDAGLPRMN